MTTPSGIVLPDSKNEMISFLCDGLEPTVVVCSERQTIITIKIWTPGDIPSEMRMRVNRKLADVYIAIFDEIYEINDPVWGHFKIDKSTTGSFNYRTIRGGNKLSTHAYGAAVDVNWQKNPFNIHAGGHDDDMTIRTKDHPVVKIFEKHGFGWGGRYGDYMHFSVFGGN